VIEAGLSPESQRVLAEKEAQFRRVANAVEHREPANRRASVALYGWIIRNYDAEGGLIGGWAPLAPATVKEKARIGKERILVRSGRLRNSLRSFFDNDQAGVGSDVPYSDVHEEGSGRVPQRKILTPRDTALDIGIKVYDHYIATAIRGGPQT
jgi:phage gpG-like protein